MEVGGDNIYDAKKIFFIFHLEMGLKILDNYSQVVQNAAA